MGPEECAPPLWNFSSRRMLSRILKSDTFILRARLFWVPSPTDRVRCVACLCSLVPETYRGAWLLEIAVLWMTGRLFNNLFLSHFIALKVQTEGMVGTIRTVQIVEVLIKIKFTILAHWGKTFCVWLVFPLLNYLGFLRLIQKVFSLVFLTSYNELFSLLDRKETETRYCTDELLLYLGL